MARRYNDTTIQYYNYTNNDHIISNLSVTAANALAVGAESSDQVGGGEETVLVSIHDTEGLLELLDGGVGERFEDVSFLRHDDD